MSEPSTNARAGRPWTVLVYAVLLALMIPWYWPEGDARQAFGFPLWALVSLGVLVATAVFTAWLYLSDDVSDE